MFTGLVEEIGTVESVQRMDGAVRLTISGEKVLGDLKVDDSIAINGVCLTAVHVSDHDFKVEAVEETLRKTTLNSLQHGTEVNLERAARVSDRLGGHLVQGHVDSIGRVTSVHPLPGSVLITIKLPPQQMKYVISEGSICINGVSLTVAKIDGSNITVSLIPHTLEQTTLGNLKSGAPVNVEVDLIGKYVENILTAPENKQLSEKWLQQLGFH